MVEFIVAVSRVPDLIEALRNHFNDIKRTINPDDTVILSDRYLQIVDDNDDVKYFNHCITTSIVVDYTGMCVEVYNEKTIWRKSFSLQYNE